MSVQEKRAACGQGYFFFVAGVLLAEDAALVEVVMGVFGSVLTVGAEVADDSGGRVVVVDAEGGV